MRHSHRLDEQIDSDHVGSEYMPCGSRTKQEAMSATKVHETFDVVENSRAHLLSQEYYESPQFNANVS